MKFFFGLIALALLSTGCLKKETDCPYTDNNIVAPAAEEEMVRQYLLDNDITSATKHTSNLYYEIINPGTGATPEVCNDIIIGYTGKFTNGQVFDSNQSTIFILGSLIEGWKKGIPLIKAGGKIRLYIPPTLGYGKDDITDRNGTVVIPGNSILIFDIDLYEVR